MPKEDITLLPEELQEEKRKEGQRRTLNLVAIGVFLAAVLALSGVLSYYFWVKSQVNAVKKQVAAEEEKILSLGEIEHSARSVEAKAKALSKIFEERNSYSILLDTLTKTTPQDISIENFSVTGAEKVSLSGTALNYVSLAKFLSAAVDKEKGGVLFAEAELTSVSLDRQTGTVDFNLNLILKEGGLKAS